MYRSYIAMSLLILAVSNVSALGIPQNQSIFSVQSNQGSITGVAKASSPAGASYPTYIDASYVTYIPVDVFSHLRYDYVRRNGSWGFTPSEGLSVATTANGLSGEPSIMADVNEVNEHGESTITVCYSDQIPANASVLVNKDGIYLVRPVDIPSDSADRKCMRLPYYARYDEIPLLGVSTDYYAEVMVVIEELDCDTNRLCGFYGDFN